MKLTTRHQCQLHNWKIFFTAFLMSVNMLQNSEAFAAVVNVPLLQNATSATISSTPGNTSTGASGGIKSSGSSGDEINHSHRQEGIPNRILGEILSLDHRLKCFPKLLCTIYQDDAITKHGALNATDLGLAYIQLLKAVYYTPTTTTEAPPKKKRPLVQIFQIPTGLIKSSTYYPGRKDHPHLHSRPHHLRRSPTEDDEADGVRLVNPLKRGAAHDDDGREFLRERIAISQMIKDLKAEDRKEMEDAEGPDGGIATSLLSSFLPFVDSRPVNAGRSARAIRRGSKSKKSQDPFWKAVSMWKKLKRRSQCQSLYRTCPFQSWEIVRMLDLVKGHSKLLSSYLNLPVDEGKQRRRRY